MKLISVIKHAMQQVATSCDGDSYQIDPIKLSTRVGYYLLQMANRMQLGIALKFGTNFLDIR